jgi:hypothetical protein
MLRKLRFKPHHKNGLIAGSITALSLSIFNSQMFKPDLLEPPWLITYYLVSLFIGGGAGFVAGFLVSRIPIRQISPVSYFVGALFGAFGYLLQLSLFLMFIFRNNPSSF